jgi:hypothetical protein
VRNAEPQEIDYQEDYERDSLELDDDGEAHGGSVFAGEKFSRLIC